MVNNTTQSIGNQINGFRIYGDELHEALLDENLLYSISNNDANLYHLLDGRATSALCQTVPVTMRRAQGIFFTNHALSEKISSKLSGLLTKGIKVADPACGAGNLLSACANYLPIGKSLEETIDVWSGLIFGYDLQRELGQKNTLRRLQRRLSENPYQLEDITIESEEGQADQ
ncbi:hypothetical protein ACFLVS_02175 [Chloroflexota bacterium]